MSQNNFSFLQGKALGQRDELAEDDDMELMAHDLLNHNQVALGYIELAMERPGLDEKTKCMLERAFLAVKKTGDLAIEIRRLSGSISDSRSTIMQTGLTGK